VPADITECTLGVSVAVPPSRGVEEANGGAASDVDVANVVVAIDISRCKVDLITAGPN